jgi:predicted nucleotidyltransferase
MSRKNKEIQGSIFAFLGNLFKKHNITSVIVGGYALIVNKVQRMTFDIDFMLTREDCEKIEPELLDIGYTVLSRQQAFLQLNGKKNGLRDLDFLITDKNTLNKIIADGKKTIIAGQEFNIPSPEHLIMMKIHSISENKKRELKDLPDIVQLLEANSINPSKKDIKEIFEKFNEKNLYKRVLGLMGRK